MTVFFLQVEENAYPDGAPCLTLEFVLLVSLYTLIFGKISHRSNSGMVNVDQDGKRNYFRDTFFSNCLSKPLSILYPASGMGPVSWDLILGLLPV